MFEDYEQNEYNMSMNENNRYINREKEYPDQNDPNQLNYSINNNNDQSYNYDNSNINNQNYNNNHNSISQSFINNNNNNYSINYNRINERYPQNFTTITEKREETNGSVTTTNNNNPKTIDTVGNRYFSKVIVENIRRPKDIQYMLDNYLTENNLEKNYKIQIEKNKITFMFYEEELAFNFTKLLNSVKSKNVLYYEMNVHLSLTPNNNYNKNGTIKKRGLSIDSIQRLFNGLGSKKQEKRHKINPNLNIGVSSPFLYPYEKKRQKKMNKGNNSMNFKLKDYNKLPIRVLDADYMPLRDPDFRPEVRDRWICPTNFKF